MGDLVKRGKLFFIGKDDSGKPCTVKCAVRAQDPVSKIANQRGKSGRTRLDHLTRDLIGIDVQRAEIAHGYLRKHAFSGTGRAGKSDDKHSFSLN